MFVYACVCVGVCVDMGTRVQNLDKVVYISHSASTLGEFIYPTFLPPAMVANSRADWMFNIGVATGLTKALN